ncbi:hypothetical protein BCR33DRAFT_40958 [Rhizoclosmatium globosum]|uniref:Uncharacterized protein n=1 Tax=Rhizoclosmatium globosum TaxID=329046 RepID=A0A1Y2CNT4_9FUNG|nr:hypothetical protein BCR33DRAFT_40958 [Rhizoclosmatium globosum]|eukprot:ORY48653.1 hypothetical protein BCR33DRAFT_40958 [Rhizoclosmatium globosum]
MRPTKFDADYDDTAEVYEKELDDPRLILSRSKSSALYETVDQLKSILEDEIMNGLLELPIKSDFFTMEYIKNSLSARHKIPSNFGETDLEKSISLSSSCICDFPLTFVHEIPNSEFASTEFSKLKLGTKSLSISQIKEYFCITGTCDWDNVKRLSFAGVKHVAGLEPRLDHGPFGDVVGTNHGLGISLTASVNEILSSSHIVQQKNWILLTFKNDYARVWYFSRFASLDEKLNMLSWVQNAILDTCNRVSKMLLLQLLKKKHRANRLLIERSIHDEVSDDEDDDDDASSSSNAITFIPNQFACPMVFSRQFSIHWRVKPSLALNAAVSSISVLAITNRKNMFVFEAGGIIVYFKLSIKEVEGEFSPTDTSRMGSIDEISLSTEALNKDSPKTASPVLSRTRGAPISSFSAHKSSESYLLLEFFGVDTPGPTITSEFVTMIESKLSLLTQREIGTYMSRNMKTVRLTPSDVDFILPAASKSPQRREFFKIPAVIDHPFKFLLYLKQALLLNLTSLPPNDLLNTLTAYYDRVYGIAFSDADLTKDNAQDINFGEMALLYNSLLARGASRFENSVGAGTAVVCLSLLNANRQVIGTVSEPPPPTRSSIEPNIAKEVYETLRNNSNTLRLRDYDLCLHDECPVMLNVEIWWSGSINADCLLDFVFKCYHDTMLDYLAECSLMYFSKLLLASRPASSLSQLDIVKSLVNTPTHKVDPLFGDLFDQMLNHLKVASCLNNSAVEELSSPIKLPATIMDGLATESRDLLIETSSALSPVLISRVSSGSGVVDLDLYSSKPKSLESADRQILILSGLQELQEMYGSTSSKPDGPIQKPSRSGSLSDTSSESLIGEQARPTSINQGADSRRVNMEKSCFIKTVP